LIVYLRIKCRDFVTGRENYSSNGAELGLRVFRIENGK